MYAAQQDSKESAEKSATQQHISSNIFTANNELLTTVGGSFLILKNFLKNL